MLRYIFCAFALSFVLVFAGCGKGSGTTVSAQSAGNQFVVAGKTTVFPLPKSGLYGQLTFNDFPAPVLKTTSLTLQFWDLLTGSPQSGPFVDPGFDLVHPNVKLWMVMPDGFAHGSKPLEPKKIVKTVGGVDQVSFTLGNAYFSMEGHWEVHLDLVKGGVSQEKVVLVYEVPEP